VIVGSRNRERRKAKQKARAARNRTHEYPGRSDQAHTRRESFRATVDTLVGAALDAAFAGEHAALERCLDGLAAAPHGEAGRLVVNRSLAGWFDRLVEAVWEDGWQPIDVHRFVTRQAGPRPARLAVDAIAAQMRRYAAATVDERWEAQLRSLDATVWWDDDDRWLDAWGDREGRDRTAVLADAVGLLSLLSTLPPIQVLCPPPGTARRHGSRGAPGHDRNAPGHGRDPGRSRGNADGKATGSPFTGAADPRILDKVRALLAKAESTGFAEEAEALTAKAQQLMARHSIDEALLAARAGARDEPVGCRVGIDNPYELPKATLLDVVAGANRCRSVWAKNLGFATVIGFRPDLDAVELLYTSLLVQATSAMTRAGSRKDHHGRSRTRSFRQSFLTSFAIRIGERLATATEQASAEAAAETGEARLLPVLAARDDTVREATEKMFPEIVAKAVTATDGEGWAFGRAAADLASLHTHNEVTTTQPG
jgi:hypothetical protein